MCRSAVVLVGSADTRWRQITSSNVAPILSAGHGLFRPTGKVFPRRNGDGNLREGIDHVVLLSRQAKTIYSSHSRILRLLRRREACCF